jgi:parvulin-like peptidyl-prolyl isomerase
MRVLFVLALTAAALGCSDFDKFYAAKKRAPTQLTERGTVIATVGSEEITAEELNKSLENMPPKQRLLYRSSPQRFRDYLDAYINQILLHKEAERRGIDKREEIMENLESYKRQLLIRAIGQEITSHEFSREEIENYYDENSKSFERIKASQVFIKATPNGRTKSDEARVRAHLVSKRAKAGENFENLVKEFSDDRRSKNKGGDIGFLSRGAFPEGIEDEIFNLKEGEISDPIETPNGFHIIKVTQGAKIPPLEEVKGRIQLDLRKRIFSEYAKKLREKTDVEIFEDKLEEISKNE